MAIYAYIRVSTKDQNIDRVLIDLREAFLILVFKDNCAVRRLELPDIREIGEVHKPEIVTRLSVEHSIVPFFDETFEIGWQPQMKRMFDLRDLFV